MKQLHEFSVDTRPWLTWAVGGFMACIILGMTLEYLYQSNHMFTFGLIGGMYVTVYCVSKYELSYRLQKLAYEAYLQTQPIELVKKAANSPELTEASRTIALSVLNNKFPGWSFA